MIRQIPIAKYWLSILVAMVLACVLAISAAAIGVLVGPCLKLLLEGIDGFSSWDGLIGPTLGRWATSITGLSGISSADLWTTVPLWLVMLASIKTVTHLCQWFIWEWTGERIARDMRGSLVEKLLYLSPQLRKESADHGETRVASVLSTDIKFVQELVVRLFGGLPRELLMLVAYLMALWALSPRLLAVFSLAILPTVIIVSSIGKRLQKRASAALRDTEELTEWLQQRLMGAETIKFYRQDIHEQNRLKQLNLKLFTRYEAAARSKSRTGPTMEMIAMAALAVVFYLSAQEIQSGHTSAAACLSFFTTLGLLSQAAGKLGRYVNATKVGSAALMRIQELDTYLQDRQLHSIQPPLKRSIDSQNRLSCANVSFRYDTSAHPVLDQVCCSFEGGRVYAICGASGAGKSTLLKLMLGLLTPETGSVNYEIAKDHMMNSAMPVGFVPQKIELFGGSIAENIAYPSEMIDESRVNQIIHDLQLSHINDRSEEAENKDQTLSLSGGQAQRVLLGRMFYHRPPFVLIDEGTSGLDPESEQLIHQAIHRLTAAGTLVLMISHRWASLEFADEVVFLEGGKVRQQGTLQQLKTCKEFLALFAES